MTLVGELFDAINHGRHTEIVACYADDACAELVFADQPRVSGRAALSEAWRCELSIERRAMAGERCYHVTRIAGIETGWGWVRADWERAIPSGDSKSRGREGGYTYFWIEDGQIRRQRSIVTGPVVPATAAVVVPGAAPGPSDGVASGRRYPTKPVVGVGAVVFNEAREVLLVKRLYEPLAQQWSLPGGGLDVGETLEAGVAREVLEETGIVVEVGPLVEAFDRILLDDTAQVRYHFVLLDYLCRPIGGELKAASDASACAWVPVSQLADYALAEKPLDVIAQAAKMTR